MGIKENIEKIMIGIPPHVKLIAVSKTFGIPVLQEAYQYGIRRFGENKAQEMIAKQNELPDDIEWHMIGHLQTNKVKSIIRFVSMIHSVDSLRLLIEINRQAKNAGRMIPCLLQIFIATEETKYGLNTDELYALIHDPLFQSLDSVSICGLMGMASFTADEAQIRKEFRSLAELFTSLKKNEFAANPSFTELSMGMSGDYHIAIEEGSTMIRIGSKIFGTRKI